MIRRDLEGQCLGLIRDGNTSTIIDVVPNSLSARHGLPPKVWLLNYCIKLFRSSIIVFFISYFILFFLYP